ncbi:Protein PRY1 [Stylophora pistillata]|uniref:Protein PRY1 n=1 Tax=Stylophora pistillata TaxID=50429 RepID=A0A2B4S923_STYPI|nr:Protein PRY1 [Stylophora pistillata]
MEVPSPAGLGKEVPTEKNCVDVLNTARLAREDFLFKECGFVISCLPLQQSMENAQSFNLSGSGTANKNGKIDLNLQIQITGVETPTESPTGGAAPLIGAELPGAGGTFTEEEEQGLAKHNEFRQVHGVPAMTLDRQMCDEAKQYAQTLSNMGSLMHSPSSERSGQGENLAMGCSIRAPQTIEEAVTNCFDDGDISEDEFLLLYDANTSKNLDYPYQNYEHFDPEGLDESECLAEFRFRKRDIPVLVDAMGLPDSYTCEQGTVCDGIEGLCLLLRRLAYPCRCSDLIHRFGRPVPAICMITNHVLETVYGLHHHRLTAWNHTLMSPPLLQRYADAIQRKGSPLPNCFGFIDGTVRPICRPQENQGIVYNGHKRVHGLKYQSVALPCGIIANMYGPVEGRKHDAGMLADSGLLRILEHNAFSPTSNPMALYGDPAYPLRVHLVVPYRATGITLQMEEFNKSMSNVRISVEWLFRDIVNYFKFVDFKKTKKFCNQRQWHFILLDDIHSTDLNRGGLHLGETGQHLKNVALVSSIFHCCCPSRYNEVCRPGYDFYIPSFSAGIGHFTQVVWKESIVLGIGIASGKKNGMNCAYIVAIYRPAGNMVGEFTQNVPEGDFNKDSYCATVKRHTLLDKQWKAAFVNNSNATTGSAELRGQFEEQ